MWATLRRGKLIFSLDPHLVQPRSIRGQQFLPVSMQHFSLHRSTASASQCTAVIVASPSCCVVTFPLVCTAPVPGSSPLLAFCLLVPSPSWPTRLTLRAPYYNLIDNELASTPQTCHGVDSSTEEALPEVPLSGKPDVDRADKRSTYLLRLADAIEANHDGIRDLDVTETGKAVQNASLEIVMVLVQVLNGDKSLGSIPTGRRVAEVCSRTLKRVTLELGGNDAAVVCDDADLAKVVPAVSSLAFLCSGQICMNIKRVYVHDKIYDAFLAAIITFIRENMLYGAATDPKTNAMQYGKVKEFFEEAELQKWRVALGGLKEKAAIKTKGLLFPLTLIDNPSDESCIVREEPFSPILPLMRWTEEEDVIHRVNAVEVGLGASVWSSSVERATKIADALEAGSVWVNGHFQVAPNMPFGGHKASGIGMDWGVVGLKGWCNPQGFWTNKA
ncbi:hypothetical protein M406DRAFT_75530 [Cryphonectria parasitica EP155]|uniref:aldehyde dehydrogenase (NAD(+)) n=1 Tax=Cryphonectria parasitica (strain ATCC 38755 / EP155) TaxID=660469 RepID=A0A9P4Y790_CRYP1|nr:uncharacterized protein M406DRAFT_75530 [Cryphonectria parasitica EP155]KAF3768202.1 hypothetical protein M406DRAFT_75530 [Cryphonectria parasitica EP155]